MSRKKCQKTENSFGGRLCLYRTWKRLTGKQLAKSLGISRPSISAYENDKTSAPREVLTALLCYDPDINIRWLLTGKGDPPWQKTVYNKDTSPGSQVFNETSEGYTVSPKEDPVVTELLEGARKVLKSGNKMAYDALERNIRYFSFAIAQEARLQAIEDRLSIIEEDKKLEEVKRRTVDPREVIEE